jgi:predicted ATPase/transcriptional regulator with XRE-family HTH domain
VPSPPTEFATLVRARRVAAGLTQAELAESAGISERTVSDLERGVRATVYPSTARRLAAALGVNDAGLAAFLEAARGGLAPRRVAGAPFETPQRSSIPVPLTAMVGRASELAAVVSLIRDPSRRLVTVCGPGGIGKSRLAAEVCLQTVDAFPGGTFFVNLAATDDPAMLLPLIATAVGVRPDATALTVSLAHRIGSEGTLLVLDTFEHLVGAGPVLAELLSICPALTVMVTSRSALNVRGEREIALPPLQAWGSKQSTDSLAPAVELFLDRADAVAPGIGRDVTTIGMVADICSRLDGLPLAIELAAAKVKHLQLPDLLAQLEHRLDALVGGARDGPARQQSMRATLEWSFEHLDTRQRGVFRALAVFRGSFTHHAAHHVSATMAEPDGHELLSALAALVDSSLLLVEAGANGQTRYRLLDVIREYAQERAAEVGVTEELRLRHAEYFTAIAEAAEPQLRGAEQRAWFSRLDDDEDNFRGALTWAVTADQPEIALRLAASLWMFWRWAGLFDEARVMLDGALDAGRDCPLVLRCQAMWGAGWLAFHHGDYERMGRLGSDMLRLLDANASSILRRNALTLVGNGALGQGRISEAITVLADALDVCEATESPWHVATSSLNLGMALAAGDRGDEAQPRYERALAIYEQLGDRHFAARSLIALAYVRFTRGETSVASVLVRRANGISAELGDAWGMAEGLEAAATVRSASAARTAVTIAGAADRLRERISMRQHPSDARTNDRGLQRAREHLPAQAFDAAWQRGRELSPEAAMALALR